MQNNLTEALASAMTPKFAISYLRVSTAGQASRGGGDDEGFSIPAQREANKRKAITRSRERNERGHLLGTVYTIREEPQILINTEVEPKLDFPILDNPTLDKPRLDSPALDKPTLENPTQLNNVSKSKTKKSITDNINHSINQKPQASESDGLIDRQQKSSYRDYYKRVKDNIEYDIITDIGNRQIKDKDDVERIDEIVDIMVDMLFPEKATVKIGDNEFPYEVVKSRLSKITAEHITYIIDCLDKNTTKIKNMAAYLRKTIYKRELNPPLAERLKRAIAKTKDRNRQRSREKTKTRGQER